MLIKKLWFLLIYIIMLIKELFECLISFSQGITFMKNFIIFKSLLIIRKNIKSFRYLAELFFSRNPVWFVLFRMALGGSLLVRLFDLKDGSILRNSKNFVVIFKLWHFFKKLINNCFSWYVKYIWFVTDYIFIRNKSDLIDH